MTTFFKYAVSILFLAMLLFLGMKLSENVMVKRRARIDENKCTANCFVKKIGNMKGDYADMVTYINGQKIIFRTSIPFYQMELGDTFTLEYKCDNIEDREVLFYRPHFLVGDSFIVTKGNITKKLFVDCIEFSYKVNGTLYSRYQKVKSYDSIDVNKTYTVGYLVSNPRRAIMKFN